MKKNKLLIIILMFLCFLKIDIVKAEIVYEEYEVGDIITYNDMEFYVIEYSGVEQDYVTLLKDIPLTTEEMTDLVSSTEIFDAIGSPGEYLTASYISKDNCVSGGDISVCSTDYSISSIKQVIDVWANAKLKDTDLKEDKLGYKTRLITYEELYNNLGYSRANWNVSHWKVNSEYTPSWVYNSNYSYWTMSAYEDSTSVVWGVNFNGEVSTFSVHNNNVVRPVINLRKKSRDEDEEKNATIDSSKLPLKEYKIGDVVKYNGMNFYVIEDSRISDKIVTLLKAEPLTVDEVNKYGKDHINRYVTFNKTAPYYRKARNQNGYGSISYLSSKTCGYTKTGTTDDMAYFGPSESYGCTSNYNASDFKYVVDNWTKDMFNSEVLEEDSLGYKTRLITLNELMNNLNYVIDDQGNYVKSEGTPSWVYNDKYMYLTMTPSDDSNDTIIAVKQDGNLSISGYYRVTWWSDNYDGVIRPVVTLKKESYNKIETGNIKENIIVKIPDTLLNRPIIIVVMGVFLIALGTVLFIYFRRKNKLNKK